MSVEQLQNMDGTQEASHILIHPQAEAGQGSAELYLSDHFEDLCENEEISLSGATMADRHDIALTAQKFFKGLLDLADATATEVQGPVRQPKPRLINAEVQSKLREFYRSSNIDINGKFTDVTRRKEASAFIQCARKFEPTVREVGLARKLAMELHQKGENYAIATCAISDLLVAYGKTLHERIAVIQQRQAQLRPATIEPDGV